MSLLSRFEKNISERGESLRVGLVGAGQMGQGIVAQLNKTKGVDLQLIVDKNQDKLEKALEKYTSQDKKTVLSQTIQSIDDLELDVVIEATGTPSSGADVAKKVLNRGIHLILLNVETEATIGLALREEAERNNCIVTVGDGDEPVAAVELFDFASELSLEVIAIGKGKNNPFDCFATPKQLEQEAISKKMNPFMLTSFVDGSKTMIEMAALANYLDFDIDVDGMHGPEATYQTLNKIYKPKSSGGILSKTGTIMSLEVNKETRLSAKNWNVEVVAFAKNDILPGTNFGSIGGELIYGKALKSKNSVGMAPLGIAENNTAQNLIKKGEPILINDVEMTENNLFDYWSQQKGLKNID